MDDQTKKITYDPISESQLQELERKAIDKLKKDSAAKMAAESRAPLKEKLVNAGLLDNFNMLERYFEQDMVSRGMSAEQAQAEIKKPDSQGFIKKVARANAENEAETILQNMKKRIPDISEGVGEGFLPRSSEIEKTTQPFKRYPVVAGALDKGLRSLAAASIPYELSKDDVVSAALTLGQIATKSPLVATGLELFRPTPVATDEEELGDLYSQRQQYQLSKALEEGVDISPEVYQRLRSLNALSGSPERFLATKSKIKESKDQSE